MTDDPRTKEVPQREKETGSTNIVSGATLSTRGGTGIEGILDGRRASRKGKGRSKDQKKTFGATRKSKSELAHRRVRAATTGRMARQPKKKARSTRRNQLQ